MTQSFNNLIDYVKKLLRYDVVLLIANELFCRNGHDFSIT